ncbi:MAG: hypothetical protein ACFFCW_36530 [Candidatus Hodarchaeota archaeon]
MSKRISLRIERTIIHLMLAATWLLFYDCGTAAADYSFYLDRFEVSGNLPVSLVDEFDDGFVSPWVIYDPYVEESGGFVSFSSPGTIEDGVLDGFYYLIEMSFIGSGHQSPFVVENGAGDFTGISKWKTIIPGVNQWYEMQVGYEGIDISVGVANWDSEFADIMGIDPGLGISFYLGGDGFVNCQHILISEDDLKNTNDILLRLDFYDDTDEFEAGFSLDGGANYQYFPDRIGWGQDTPGHYEWYFSGQSIELQIIQPSPVAIDIKPGSFPNSINLDSKGVIPVAILGTEDFDASTVEPETVGFGPLDALPVHWALEDVDGDGYIDWILQFKNQETGIQPGDTEATLTGKTVDGQDIIGSDSVRTVPKGKK